MANNGPVKKVPERMCTGCKVHKPKKELIRVVKAPDGEISVDFHGKKSGRGAYVCPSMECLKKARKSRALERALELAIPETMYDAMEAQMEQA